MWINVEIRHGTLMPGHYMMFREHVEPVKIATNYKENIRMLILVTLKSFF